MSTIDHQGCFVVQYKGENISVCLTRKQVKNINLRIKSDRTVAVSAAREVPLQLIEDLVRKILVRPIIWWFNRHCGRKKCCLTVKMFTSWFGMAVAVASGRR